MNIKLNVLSIENFKGIKAFTFVPEGKNAKLSAANGIGKTTVYDSFFWLLFGKASDGRKEFGIRPVNCFNDPIPNIITAVQAELDIDGTVHVLRKEHREKRSKDWRKSYEVKCWIDEVSKKVGQYNTWVSDIIPEDTFKLLTDLYHFNAKLHWSDRRQILMDISGDVGTPEGFDTLLGELNGRTIDEYKSILNDQKKRCIIERDEITPRIDELQRGMDSYAETEDTSTGEAERKRDAAKEQLAELEKKRLEVSTSENLRLANVDKLNGIKVKLAERESEVKNDTSWAQHLFDEKTELSAKLSEADTSLANVKREVVDKEGEIYSCEQQLKQERDAITEARNEYKELNAKPVELTGDSPLDNIADTCYACGQSLPKDKVDAMIAEVNKKRDADLTELKDKRQKQLSVLATEGKDRVERIKNFEKMLSEFQEDLRELLNKLGFADIDVKEAKVRLDARTTEIEEEIKKQPTLNPATDLEWQKLDLEYKKLEKEIGEPLHEEISKIDAEMKAIREVIEGISETLANSDRIDRDKKRIDELKTEGQALSQKLADIEAQLEEIAGYNADFSALIESSVNGKFKHVNFKMFNTLLNGTTEACCEALLKGVSYADQSFGQQIMVGVDIVNVLAEHYRMSVPLFIDGAESLTLPVEFDGQAIQLHAVAKVAKLKAVIES